MVDEIGNHLLWSHMQCTEEGTRSAASRYPPLHPDVEGITEDKKTSGDDVLVAAGIQGNHKGRREHNVDEMMYWYVYTSYVSKGVYRKTLTELGQGNAGE